jgi:hypothetical protein
MLLCVHQGCSRPSVQGSKYCETHLTEAKEVTLKGLGYAGMIVAAAWAIFGYLIRKR